MPVQRWPNKPTSGRYVYKGKTSGRWYWQCDLHPGEEDEFGGCYAEEGTYGEARTWRESFAMALLHARQCLFSNKDLPETNRLVEDV